MLKKTYVDTLFFILLSGVIGLYVTAFLFPFFLNVAHAALLLLILLLGVDFCMLFFQKEGIKAHRILPEKLSNGDENTIQLNVQNFYFFTIRVKIIDEIPFQFQKRDFLIKHSLKANQKISLEYTLKPQERGVYDFGGINIFVQSPFGLISRRFVFQKGVKLPSYPSFIHLRKYELMAVQNEFLLGGIKKIRRLGHTLEFEQIKDYVSGDDIRTINWKATSKQNKLMVNQYQEEKSQRIYMLLDKGRTMQMPFDGLSLLDYSINATMALSHIILKKNDRAGIMAFSRKAENKVMDDGKPIQLKKISEALYNLQTDFVETDFGRLYQEVKLNISQRSLLLLFTNFETLDAVNRQMKYLRAIAKNHLLLVVFFKNTALQDILNGTPKNIQEVYDEIIAEKFEFEKELIIQELRKYGIHTLYTAPRDLNIEVINKYLQIKSSGLL